MSRVYVPQKQKSFRNTVNYVTDNCYCMGEIDIAVNHKRAFTRVNSQIVKVVKGKSGDDNAE